MVNIRKTNPETPNIPSWVGNYPFSPQEKKPVVMDREKSILFVYGKGSHKVSCTTAISTNHIQAGMMVVQPGEYFEPPDIHSGDEVYYILDGEGVVMNPETGRGGKAGKGDVVLIPKGVWHQTFNTDDRNLRALAFIAPLQWQAGQAAVPAEFTGKTAYYKGEGRKTAEYGPWPKSSKAPDLENEISFITDRDALHLIHGTVNHFLISFYVSNRRIHVGKISLPRGFRSDLESHPGDEILFVEKGELAVEVHGPADTDEATVNDVFEIGENHYFLIPEGMKHRYLNFSDSSSKILIGIAPQL
jgi:mannose-6-phosphate isomerase-like protein (cupin superfamily)